ncbi:hypothetical protein HAX54_030110 [Datura stramonium]|uniref:PB1-like domain-containing protein n=1 Tax=Datura stramonium TaxID=4076 RepID=A0ABS8V9G1_DATST|nr:hypothetical protein [Datura stramonium]
MLDLSIGQPIYNGGQTIEFLDVDADRMSYVELRGYIKKLRYTTTCTFSIKPPNNDILVDIVDDMDILDVCYSLEDGDTVEVGQGIGEDTLYGEKPFTTSTATTSAATRASYTTTLATTSSIIAHGTTLAPASANGDSPNPATRDGDGPAPASANGDCPDPTNADGDGQDLGSVGSDFTDEENFDYSTIDSVEPEGGLVGDEEEDYDNDVHEEPPSEGELQEKKEKGIPRNKPATPNVPPSATASLAYPTHTAPLDYPASSSAPYNFHASSSVPATGKRGRGMGRGSTNPYKRLKVIGMGVFEAEDGFKVLNVADEHNNNTPQSIQNDLPIEPTTFSLSLNRSNDLLLNFLSIVKLSVSVICSMI